MTFFWSESELRLPAKPKTKIPPEVIDSALRSYILKHNPQLQHLQIFSLLALKLHTQISKSLHLLKKETNIKIRFSVLKNKFL